MLKHLAAAALAASAPASASPEAPPLAAPIAIQAWSFHSDLDKGVEAAFAKMHALGFRNIELYGLHGRTPAQMKALLAAHELTPVGMHVSIEDLAARPEQIAADAKAAGIPAIGVAWLKPAGAPKVGLTRAELDAAAAVFKRACPAFRAAGLTLYTHTHGNEFLRGQEGTMFDRLMRAVPPECLKVEIDTFWAQRAGQDPVAMLRRLGSRVYALHLKDLNRDTLVDDHTGTAEAADNVAVGSGQIAFPALFAEAKRVHVRWAIIEDETDDANANVLRSIAYLRRIGAAN